MSELPTDPFIYDEYVMDRLRKEYSKHKKLIVAVDFDDTVYPWTHDNSRHNLMFDLLQKCQKHEFYLVAFTASDPERYDFIREYFDSFGIHIHGINQNVIPLRYGNNGKIYYNIFLDDRAGLRSAFRNLQTLIHEIENDLL